MISFRRRPKGPLWAPKYASSVFAGRHPFQLFLLVLSFVTGLPLLLNLGGQSVTTAPPVSVSIWGLMLVGGSLTALLGTYRPKDVITRMTLERIGLTAIGYGALLYGTVTVFETRSVLVALEVGILVGFAITCLIRSYHIAAEIRLFAAMRNDDFK